MNRRVTASAVAAILLASGAVAATDEDAHPAAMHDAHMERMEAMHKQMESIRSAEDPEKRRELMHEHMKSMREAMMGMRGMMGDGEHRERGMGHHGSRGKGDDDCLRRYEADTTRLHRRQQLMAERMAHMEEHLGGSAAMLEQMHRRMDMMQEMMEQMMAQQEQFLRVPESEGTN